MRKMEAFLLSHTEERRRAVVWPSRPLFTMPRIHTPPPELVSALARLQAAQPASTVNACDGGDFGCAACASAADLLGDRLSAWLRAGPAERAEFLAAGGGTALVVRL